MKVALITSDRIRNIPELNVKRARFELVNHHQGGNGVLFTTLRKNYGDVQTIVFFIQETAIGS